MQNPYMAKTLVLSPRVVPLLSIINAHSSPRSPITSCPSHSFPFLDTRNSEINSISMAEHHPHQQQQQPMSTQIVKAVSAATAGGSMLLLSGLTLAGTVIALTVSTPLLVIFSPVLVPAAIVVFLIVSGFVTSGGFGIAALSVLSWMYKYVTGKHPVGADQIDQAQASLAAKARDIKESAQYRIDQAQAS